jgi:very-short-patch-repair endonuclease
MTPAEKALWEEIRRWKIYWKQFQKQKPIFVYKENSKLSRYIIADFICLEDKLIIELDGSIHNIPEVLQLDKYKEQLLENLWFRVLRFKNVEVFDDLEDVLWKIEESFKYSSPESSPLITKERDNQTTRQ